MNPHDVRSTDGEVCCNCGRKFPTLAAHTSHFGIETARAAIAGRVESPTRASGPDEGRSSSQENGGSPDAGS